MYNKINPHGFILLHICDSKYFIIENYFILRSNTSLKECYETEFWFELFVKSELATEDEIRNLYNQCGTIRRILVASINTAKEK